MDSLVMFSLIGLGVFMAGLVIGWIGRGHVHDIATAAATAAARATTVSSGDVAALNAKLSGLGDQVAALAQKAQQPVVAAVDKATTAAGA